jgi:hypothetical protein
MRRTLLALSLTASLVTTVPSGFFDRLWSLLSAIWGDSPPVHQPQTKEGCGGDPDGLCNPSTAPQTDEGCGWDPNGLCNPGS